MIKDLSVIPSDELVFGIKMRPKEIIRLKNRNKIR